MVDVEIHTADQEKLCQCPVCLDLNGFDEQYCQQCHAHLHIISPNSIQQTLALLLTSVILLIPANFLPMMSTTFLGEKTQSTILGGVLLLWQHQSYLVATVIFFASIVIPIGKLLALTWLCYEVRFRGFRSKHLGQKLYRLTEFIGKWSMIDVYVVAILVAMVQMGMIMKIEPGVAAIAFSGLVITTMLAALTFDPRLIWQHCDNPKFERERS
ncbi:MAG: paraquat-inducible protein A [Colwellia sp.]|nr:paraquat-inducible protein A [Colwellia sp.]